MPNPRSDYSNIFEREPLKLPGGARVVVWPVINVEEWDINEPMARTVLPVPQGRSVIPDVPNYAWYDYGMRVGFWRMKQVLDRHGIRATVSLNASVCNTYPHLVEESLKSGWEMMAHGFIQRIINAEPDQRETIRKTIRAPIAFNGREIFLTASIGLALSDPQVPLTEEIIKDAELAMYHSKRIGGALQIPGAVFGFE